MKKKQSLMPVTQTQHNTTVSTCNRRESSFTPAQKSRAGQGVCVRKMVAVQHEGRKGWYAVYGSGDIQSWDGMMLKARLKGRGIMCKNV